MVGERMRNTCAGDMSKMGLEVISFTIKEVRDKNEYISNMGRPDIARIKRDADVATAEAERDTAIRRAQAVREAAIAKAQADQERVLAETLSLAKQSEAQRDLDIKKAQYLETVKHQQAQADKAYEIQTNVMQQQVVAEQVKISQIEKEGADQGAGSRNPAARARAGRHGIEAGRGGKAAYRNPRRGRKTSA